MFSASSRRSARLDDPDTMLHVVIGRWMLAHHAVPHADVFTYTMPGMQWVAHEWLGEVVSAVMLRRARLARAGGDGEPRPGRLAVAIFARALLRYYTPAQTIVIACAAWFVVTPHWLARPHIVALPLLVLWMALLVRARQENRAPPLVDGADHDSVGQSSTARSSSASASPACSRSRRC